jgi:WD40 repeat protein
VIRRLFGPVGGTNGLRFSSDGTLVGVAGNKHGVVWDAHTGKVVQVLWGSDAIAFSPDGREVALSGAKNATRLFDLRTGDPLLTLRGDDGTPQDLDFSPDGKLLAIATLAGHADLWDVATGKSVATLANSTGQAFDSTLRFSPDGKLLAVGDSSGTAVLWDVAKRQPFGAPLTGHNGKVDAVGFDPSGRTLVTMSDDGNLRLWDVATQKLIGAPIPVNGGGGSAEFFPDGKHVLADFGPSGVVFDVDPADWEGKACRIANRELTRKEWKDFLGRRTYHPVCGAALPS